MKILFALVKDASTEIEEKILEAYKKAYGEEFIYKKEYYKAGIDKALEDEHFDIVFINERLEVEPISSSYVDKLTDKYNNLRVSLVMDDIQKSSDLPKKIFSLGAYDCLFKEDLVMDKIVKLINKPRSKKDAKLYYSIDDNNNDIEINTTGVVAIPDDELDTVLENFNGATEETIEELFNLAERTYQFPQCVYLISILGEETRNLIQSVCPKQFKKYERALDREITKVEIREKIVETVKVVERIVEKPVEKIKIEKQIVETEVIKEVYQKPSDYKKVLAFTGTSNGGTTTIVESIAKILSDNNVKVAIVDLANNKDLFERHIFNSDEKREPLQDLITGLVKPYMLSNKCSLYTSSPKSHLETDQSTLWRIIDLARKDNEVTLIDVPLNIASEIYSLVDKINIVTTQDILDVKEINIELNRWLESDSVYNNPTKIDFIINKYISDKGCIDKKNIVDCCTHMISDYMNTNENYQIVKLDNTNIGTIKFDMDILKKSYSAEYFTNNSDSYKEDIEIIVNNLYKLNSKKSKNSIFGKLKKILK